jgi:muramoyltetrapeptide carboxypeptidase
MTPVSVASFCSPVGPLELELGLQKLRRSGLDPIVHDRTLARDFVSAGTDAERAAAFLDCAADPTTRIVWAARGGYGAGRLLPLLEARLDQLRAYPKKCLVGYSDMTVLLHFARTRLGWSTLHAPMVSRTRTGPADVEWDALCRLLKRESVELRFDRLDWIDAPGRPIEAELVGGNLSLWHTLTGTRWQPEVAGKIIMLEDVGEKLYAIDRYVVQLEQAGLFDDVAAVVLGDFTDCVDEANTMLDPNIAPAVVGDDIDWHNHPRVPLRPTFSTRDGLIEIFTRVTRPRGIPLAMGLPVGHGPGYWPLPMGAQYRIERQILSLVEWDWTSSPCPTLT